MGECQRVLLGRCLEFHFNNGIMKIGVMQMHKRIAFGKCVDVLYSCYARLKKENRSEQNIWWEVQLRLCRKR